MLQVHNLTVKFLSGKVENKVVKKISFDLKENKILGIVGESGSGKSVTSLAVLGLLPKNTIQEGDIFFDQIYMFCLYNKFSKNKFVNMFFLDPHLLRKVTNV